MNDAPTEHLIPMPLATLPAGAIFDCDGTLVDTMPLHFVAWRKTLDALGHPTIFPETQFYEWGGTPAKEIMERLNVIHGLTLPPHETATEKEEIYRTLITDVKPLTFVIDEAIRLHAAGVPLAVASGGRRDVVIESLETVGIRDLFGPVVGSEDVANGKPAPDVFLRAAELLGVAPERCVVFEDAPAGLLAAHRAGMKAVDIIRFL